MSEPQIESVTRARRVFLNNTDSYSSRTITKVLSEEPENASQLSRTETFQVVGTGSDQSGDARLQLPLTEEMFQRRRAHPSFIQHVDLEKRVIRLGKSNPALFSTYVVASGLQYGMGEQIFYSYFKNSWLGMEAEMFGDGKNVVPTIHISDLARIVLSVIRLRPNVSYLLAVDSSTCTLEDMVKAISSALGSGQVRKKPAADLFLLEDMSMSAIRSLQINLQLEAVHIKKLPISWRCESGLVENMQLVLEEFLQNRGLLPLRLCVLGPPAVGKTTVSKWICECYRLHHVTLKDVVAPPEEVLKNSDPAEESWKLLIHLQPPEENSTDASEGQVGTLRAKLKSISCRNQGFVLGGFPHTYEQAKKLFGEEADGSSSHSRMILPEFVLCLDASDSFLMDRVMDLPQHMVQQLGYQPEDFLRCLAAYRENNSVDKTVLTYYEERNVTALHLEITSGEEQANRLVKEKILNMLGPPRVLSPPKVEDGRNEAEEKLRREAKEKAEEARSRAALWQEWTLRLEQMKLQEEQELEDLTGPMKSYLQEHVMPVLTRGLIHCCRRQPPDPVAFLSEFLFQNGPFNAS